MKVKLHQLLTAYVCDTAQTEVTGKGAQKYLADHDIVDSDLQRLSLQERERRIRTMELRILCIDFYCAGMEKVLDTHFGEGNAPGFDAFYENYLPKIEKLL